jgi:hypothetical protein
MSGINIGVSASSSYQPAQNAGASDDLLPSMDLASFGAAIQNEIGTMDDDFSVSLSSDVVDSLAAAIDTNGDGMINQSEVEQASDVITDVLSNLSDTGELSTDDLMGLKSTLSSLIPGFLSD